MQFGFGASFSHRFRVSLCQSLFAAVVKTGGVYFWDRIKGLDNFCNALYLLSLKLFIQIIICYSSIVSFSFI